MAEIDPDMLEPLVLRGEDKEQYLQNLEKGFMKLSSVLGSGNLDSSISEYVSSIAKTISLLRYKDENKDPKDNIGIYKEIKMDKRSGFPTVEEMVLFSSKAASAEKDLKRLGTTQEAGKKAIDVLLNYPASDKSIEELEKANDTIRAINFAHRLQVRDYIDLPKGVGSKTMDIDLIGETDKVENFKSFYAAWDITKYFFSAYCIHMDDDKEKYMKLGPDKPGHVFKRESEWAVSDEVKQIMATNFGLNPTHYFKKLNELEGIHPKKVSYLGIESFESKHRSKFFGNEFKMNPGAGILTATVITLTGREEEGQGKTRQTVYDAAKDSEAKLYVICSDDVKAGVIDYYKHNKNIEFEIIPF